MFSACLMTGTLILTCYGFVCEFIVPLNNECSIVEVVDNINDDDNVHMKQSIVGNLDDGNDEKSQEDISKGEDENGNSSDDVDTTSGENIKDSKNNRSNQSNSGTNKDLQSSSTDSSGGAEPNRRWIPERVETINHPAETEKVKTCIVTCMCGEVFSAKSGPAAVAQYQAHRPVP